MEHYGQPRRCDVVGLDAVAFQGNHLYAVVAGACLPPGALPPDVTAQLGKVLRLKGGTSFASIGDPSSARTTLMAKGSTRPLEAMHPARWCWTA